MEVPKSILGWVVGLVLGLTAVLAGQSLLSVQTDASRAVDTNAKQDTELAVIKARLDWQSQALLLLLRERGLEPPPPK